MFPPGLVSGARGLNVGTIAPVLWLVTALPPAITPTYGVSGGPRVEVTGLDGQATTGELSQLVPEIQLFTEAGRVAVAWSDVLSLRPLDVTASRPAAPEDALRFELADGSAFGAQIVAGEDAGCVVRFAPDTTCRLELSLIRSIVAGAAPPRAVSTLNEVVADAARGAAEGREARERAELTDVAVVARGDEVLVLRGRVRRLAPESVTFEWSGRQRALPWDRVVGVVFAQPTPRTAPCVVRCAGGAAFAGRIVGGSERGLTLRSGVFEGLELKWSEVERIDCRSERLVFLSDLEPARYEFEPFFDKRWDYAKDKTLTGRPIRLGGREYARGITLHSRAALTYRLAGRFEQFAATVGIVDEMGSRGCATLRVLGDGRVLWEVEAVRGGEAPREIIVDVAGVQELTLLVDYGAELDLSDHAGWAFARLIR